MKAVSVPKLFILVDLYATLFPLYYRWKVFPGAPPKLQYIEKTLPGMVKQWDHLTPVSVDSRKKEFDDRHVLICHDRGTPVRRQDFPEYKAQRKSDPDANEFLELAVNFFVQRHGQSKETIPTRMLPDPSSDYSCEADDVINTCAKHLSSKGHSSVIVSADKDLMQLVNPKEGVHFWQLKKYQMLDREKVLLEMGVWPEQIVDFLALVGDSVDNIPGIKGVGKKRAISLLGEFGNLDRILKLAKNETEFHNEACEKAKKAGKKSPPKFIPRGKLGDLIGPKTVQALVEGEEVALKMKEKVISLRFIDSIAKDLDMFFAL